jgi:DMSO reductase anchor subunit
MVNLLGVKSGDFAILALLALELAMTLSAKPKAQWTVYRLRVGLIAVALLGAAIMSVVPNQLGMWTSLSIFLVVLVEEIIGRWLFYETLKERPI